MQITFERVAGVVAVVALSRTAVHYWKEPEEVVVDRGLEDREVEQLDDITALLRFTLLYLRTL